MRITSTRFKMIFSLVIGFCAVQLSAQSFNTMTITEPASIAGDYTIVSADFGLDATATVSGSLTIGVDDTAPESDACTELTNDLSGNIGLIDRGACEFGTKVLNAENAGAIAVLVCNNAPGAPIGMGPGDFGDQVTVYAAMATQADCNLIKAELEDNNVAVSFSYIAPPCTAEYDSTVVWGALGEGQFDGGLGDWVSTGITAETDVFVHDALGLNRGAIRNETYSIASPSVCNGAMIMDYDFLSTGGDGAVLNSLAFPYPEHSGNLISPLIDLSGADFPQVEFYQFQLPLNGSASFAYSIDDGENWTEEILIDTENILSASIENIIGTELMVIQMPEAANQSEVRMRFTATGNDFYFWIIDDVVVKSFQKVDVRANRNFFAVAPNYKTPINQVDDMAFLIDVENIGNTDIINASVNATIIQDATGDVVYTADLAYGDIAAGFLDENRVFPDTWLPTNELGTYSGSYTITSDNDEDPSNDTQSFTYEITEEEFAKVISEEEAGVEYLGDRAAPNEYFQSYGNYYYIPNGAGLVAKNVNFGVVVDDLPASSGFITFAMYQWFDTNEDGVCQGTERLELYKEEILISDELTAAGLRNMSIDLTGENIELTDDGHYLVMANMRPLQNTGSQYRIVAASTEAEPQFNYAAMNLGLFNEFGVNRFGSMSGTGTDNTPQDVEARDFGFNGAYSVYMPLTIGMFSDVDDLNNDLNVKVFPNPASDRLIVDLILENNSETVGLTLTSVDGKVLLNEKVFNVQYDQIDLDITNVPAGIYMLNVQTTDGYTSKKVVVSK